MFLLRLDRATLTVDGVLAERELRDLLADVQFGKFLGKGLFVNFTSGKLKLAAGSKGWTLITIQGVVSRGSTIELPLQPALLLRPWSDNIVTSIAKKLHPLATPVTGANPTLVIDLNKLPGKYKVTVDSVAFVPGAAIVTLGECGVRSSSAA